MPISEYVTELNVYNLTESSIPSGHPWEFKKLNYEANKKLWYKKPNFGDVATEKIKLQLALPIGINILIYPIIHNQKFLMWIMLPDQVPRFA